MCYDIQNALVGSGGIMQVRTTDSKARLILPKSFANATVIIDEISETEIRVRRAQVVAEDELRFPEECAKTLSNRDRDAFIELLTNPPSPNAALKRAVKRHKARNNARPS